MGIVQDLLGIQRNLAQERLPWEKAWRECVNLFMPYASHRFDYSGATMQGALTGTALEGGKSVERSREIYDSTAVWCMDRLRAGVESLITPRSQKWHTFSLDDPFGLEPSDVEEEWLDTLRDYHFAVRYDSRSGFSIANQKALASTVCLGTGIFYLEENLGRKNIDPVKVPFFYRAVPLVDCYLGIDAYDDVDKCVRVSRMSARAAASYFGASKVSDKVRSTANNTSTQDQLFTFMHVVLPREDAGSYSNKRKGQSYAAFWVELETSHLISHSGFFSFPYVVEWWDQVESSAYGQSAPMGILSDIKMLQVMSKTAVQAAQQMVKPPMATMAGLYNSRLNLNSGAVNAGYIDEQGRPKAQPLITGTNPTLAENLMELKRAGIRESLYTNLFQILAQNPNQTATEALIRANEKGELLGPAGTKIETGIARAVDREVDIVQRKGAFELGSPLEPPSSMRGRDLGVRFTGPLARLRRLQEVQGVESVLGLAGQLAQYSPRVAEEAMSRIDVDETLEIVREIRGAPRKMFRTDEEVAQRRQASADMQENQAALQAMEMIGAAAGKATPAIKAATEASRAA